MEIFVLKEGDFSVSKNKEFYGLDEFPGGLKMAVQPFLVQMEDDLVLLDAGLGLMENDRPMLFRLLAEDGFDPSDVRKILISHFHKDHVDGLIRLENDGYVPNFPDATIYYQKRELDYALTQSGNPSYNFETLEFIAKLPNLVDLTDDSGNITDEISFEVTGGHSHFHQEFWLRQNGETIFYGADNLPQKSYLDFHIAYKSDDDGKKAAAARLDWKAKAEKEQWKILLFHDMAFPVVTLPTPSISS